MTGEELIKIIEDNNLENTQIMLDLDGPYDVSITSTKMKPYGQFVMHIDGQGNVYEGVVVLS